MKKTLSLIAAGLFVVSASAQVETVWSTQEGLEALGLSSDATEIAEGTVLAEGEAGVFSNCFTDKAKIMSISSNDVKSVKVNGQEFALTTGTTGSSNPGGIGIESAPTSGWCYNFSCKKDGWAVIFSKLSSNKAYYVFEGETGPDQPLYLIGYTLSMVFKGEPTTYVLPGDQDGYFTMDLPDASKYSDGVAVFWPETIFQGFDANPDKNDPTFVGAGGFGCVYFPVLAGYEYIFSAQGSKANTNGVVFCAEEPTQIIGIVPEKTNADTGEVTPGKEIVFLGEGSGEGGVGSVAVDQMDENAPVYNVLGQRVSKNAKGLLIQNGRKFYNR